MIPNPAEPHRTDPTADRGLRRTAVRGRRPFVASPGLLLLRVAIMVLGLTIGVVLLTRGDLVLGLLLVTFTGLRLGVLVALHRRRRPWRAARGGLGRP